MKIRKIIVAVVLVLALQRLSAQTDSSSGLEAATAPPPLDSIVQLTADYYGLPAWQSQLVPRTGTFWTLTPGSSRALPFPCPPPGWGTWPVYLLGNDIFLVDSTAGDSGANAALLAAQAKTVEQLIDQVNAANPPARQRVRAMDKSGPEPDSGTGGLPEPDGQTDNPIAPVDYGTNLWLEITNISGVWVNLLLSNTEADVEYQILGLSALAQADQATNWISEGVVYGSETTNWTPATIAAFSPATNLFLRALSWASEDGSGLPTWWELKYFGTTGINPNAQDSAGDGWTIYQKYAMGVAPNVWVTPPAPQGVTVTFKTSGIATLTWLPSPGPVTSYTVTTYDELTGETTTFTTNSTAFAQNLSAESTTYLADGWPKLFVDYSVVANYGSNGSSALGSASLQNTSPAVSVIFRGWQGNICFALSGLPTDLSAINVYRNSELGWIDGIPDLDNGAFSIPATSITNGIFQIPASQVLPNGIYNISLQTVRSNGVSSDWAYVGNDCSAVPFVDERPQLKDNLRFLLRAANPLGPFTVGLDSDWYGCPNNYVCSSGGYNVNNSGVDYSLFKPTSDNYFYRNFVFDQNNLDAGGFLNTGCYYGGFLGYNNCSTLFINGNPSYAYYDADYITSGVEPTSLLNSNQTTWIADPLDPYAYPINPGRNFYGLSFLSVEDAYVTNNELTLTTYNPSQSIPQGYYYYQMAQPVFQATGYYFARPGTDPTPDPSEFLELQSGFSPTNKTPLMIFGLGNPVTIAGYAQLAIQNSSSNVPCYLGQYFEQAYQINTNGNVTANPTGILSPYGDFFATQPGPAALVTMPDIDTGAQGTCTVYAVSLQVDKNHDTNMANLSFNSPDATSPASPMIFWCNNNYDRWVLDKDDGTNYDDDVLNTSQAAMCPYTPNTPTPDYNYRDQYGNRMIPCARDLEDFTRLWICGVDSNLVAKLPAGSTITLNWGDVGSPNPDNPTIDLFHAVEPDGGTGYLTNAAIAEQQANPFYAGYVGRVGPGHSLQLYPPLPYGGNFWQGSHYIWCGVSNGTGGLNLTIQDGNGNVLAQTTAYIQIQDIKQMYERWTIGDVANATPLTNALPATEDLPVGASAFQYTPPQNTTTPYILYVHGWNMDRYDKDRFAEAAFKRLYWQGYHGRFGVFRWPTDYDFNATLIDAILQPHNYDSSENQAWNSAAGLLYKLQDLNSAYPGRVYVLAHSMGNVVTGEALRLAAQQGLGQIVNTYVASQAAIPAHVYDASVTSPYLINYTYFAHGYPAPGAPQTPNIYWNRLTNNTAAAGRKISFYNVNDYALNANAWCFDQEHKPDTFPYSGFYHYSGSTNDLAPWNHFEYVNNFGGIQNLDIINSLTDLYLVLGYAANPYSTAYGATPGITNIVNVNLANPSGSMWPSPDPLGKSYSSHFWHSAQFRGDLAWEWGYWNTLLFSSQFGFGINNP